MAYMVYVSHVDKARKSAYGLSARPIPIPLMPRFVEQERPFSTVSGKTGLNLEQQRDRALVHERHGHACAEKPPRDFNALFLQR
jgi:hypothetical protein